MNHDTKKFIYYLLVFLPISIGISVVIEPEWRGNIFLRRFIIDLYSFSLIVILIIWIYYLRIIVVPLITTFFCYLGLRVVSEDLYIGTGRMFLVGLVWYCIYLYIFSRYLEEQDELDMINSLPNIEYYRKQLANERAEIARIESLPEPSLSTQIHEQQLERRLHDNRLAIQLYGKPFDQLTNEQKEKLMK